MVADIFPRSTHVFDCGDIARDDILIWEFAKANDLIILTKDSDFQRLSFVFGAPPKVVWLKVGNAGTAEIARILRAQSRSVVDLAKDSDAVILVIDP